MVNFGERSSEDKKGGKERGRSWGEKRNEEGKVLEGRGGQGEREERGGKSVEGEERLDQRRGKGIDVCLGRCLVGEQMGSIARHCDEKET
eukprot:640113-Hanusia_phi.AAC.1